MEEIKFRGKRLYDQAETTKHYAEDKGVWKYGTYTYAHKYRGGEHGHLICDIYGRPVMCDKKTIGQFIGLKAKNLKSMYTGDIISIGNKDTTFVIVYDQDECRYIAKSIELEGITLYMRSKATDVYEVIGNIHDEVKD